MDRRDLSLLLLSTMFTAAGLDWFERGDVFARVAALRPGTPPGTDERRELAEHLGTLLAGTDVGTAALFAPTGPAGFAAAWNEAFDIAGRRFAEASDQGTLHRGLRTVLSQVVIFHWNRLGFKLTPQRLLAYATTDVHLPPND
jgi:thiopeptide-type bacteriocin biosynthesis protein